MKEFICPYASLATDCLGNAIVQLVNRGPRAEAGKLVIQCSMIERIERDETGESYRLGCPYRLCDQEFLAIHTFHDSGQETISYEPYPHE